MSSTHPVTGPQEAVTRVHAMVYGGAVTTVILLAAGIVLFGAGTVLDSNRFFYSGLIVLLAAGISAAATAILRGQQTSLGQLRRTNQRLKRVERFEAEMFNAARDDLARRRNRRIS